MMVHRSAVFSRPIGLILWALITVVSLPANLYGHDNLPYVTTVMKLIPTEAGYEDETAEEFGKFNNEEKKTIKSQIASYLSKQCEDPYGFLMWQPLTDEMDLTDSGRPILQILIAKKSNRFGDIVFLVIGATFQNSSRPVTVISNDRIYDRYDDQPTHNAVEFVQKIESTLTEKFRNESFRQLLYEKFLKTIPLTHTLHVDRSAHRLIVPLEWDSLKAAPKSKLEVHFKANSLTDDHQEPQPGLATLYLEGPSPNDAWRGLVQCGINFFSFPDIDQVSAWNPAIGNILEPSNVLAIDVYMDQYLQNLYPDQIDGTVIEP